MKLEYPPLSGEDILLTFNRTYANISLLIDKNKKNYAKFIQQIIR